MGTKAKEGGDDTRNPRNGNENPFLSATRARAHERTPKRLLLGEMPSGVGYCRGWGRATLENGIGREGPRTSTDPLLPNPFSLPEMTERVKNNGSGRGGYDPLTRKRAENANERELREGASNSNPKELNADSKDTRGEEPC